MRSKLTLRLDEEVIEQTKRYARVRGKSLSQIVEDHFRGLTHPRGEKRVDGRSDTPITRSLRGILKDKPLDERDYRRHMEDKYL